MPYAVYLHRGAWTEGLSSGSVIVTRPAAPPAGDLVTVGCVRDPACFLDLRGVCGGVGGPRVTGRFCAPGSGRVSGHSCSITESAASLASCPPRPVLGHWPL